MADLDTAAKRFSGINVGLPWRGMGAFPSGTIGAAARAAVAFLYSGIALTDAVPVVPPSDASGGGGGSGGGYYEETRHHPPAKKAQKPKLPRDPFLAMLMREDDDLMRMVREMYSDGDFEPRKP